MADTINNKYTAWIVDDDPIARLLIKKTLERSNRFATYTEFSDGSGIIDAIAGLKKSTIAEPDLILLDLNMPDIDGWTVLDFIHEEQFTFRKANLIILTSSINPKDKSRAFSYNWVKGYLNKPLDQDQINSLEL